MRIFNKLAGAPCWLIKNSYFFFNRFRFKHVGTHVRIYNPLKINGLKNIFIGDNVCINDGVWLAALPLTGSNKTELVIEDGSVIGHFNHIYATQSIILQKDVLTADKVYISDNLHGYEDINVPIMRQPIRQCKPVVIGEGSWLGENVCIIGASIGKHCVIGANSVVTHDIPDYCVAVGAPAFVVKKYDFESEKWISVIDNKTEKR